MENAPTPEEGAVCLLVTVPVSFKAVVSAKSSNAPDGRLGEQNRFMLVGSA